MQLEQKVVYGPVWTRRFGWDLGINLLLLGRKLCTFDCVYCQYGVTPPIEGRHLPASSMRIITWRLPDVEQVVCEWEAQLKACALLGLKLIHTTVSGNGEPTMHPRFSELALGLTRGRDRHNCNVKLAVLSNGYRLYDPRIREAMFLFDEPIIKLDSAVAEKWKAINRPMIPLSLAQFIGNLRECKGIIIQSMFLQGWNDAQADLEAWRVALADIQPREVQIYTVTRTPALPAVEPVPDPFLQELAEDTSRRLGIPVKAFV